MSYTEKRILLEEQRDQSADTIKAIATLQSVDGDTATALATIQALIDGGSFNLIDAEIKAPLVTAYNALNNLRTAFNTDAVREALDWRP